MAERWQQWMPFHIDRWKGSAHVQAMCAAARAGYLYLLAEMWQSGDCTVPDDDMELQVLSGLTSEEWTAHGPRIRRRFTTSDGKLSNDVLRDEWRIAKDKFERTSEERSKAGKLGNEKRWGRKCDSFASQNDRNTVADDSQNIATLQEQEHIHVQKDLNTLASTANAVPAPERGKLIGTVPVLKPPGDYELYEADASEWQDTFPGIDVKQELRKCKQWCVDNPKLRKTRSGIRRFINSWLSRAQNGAGNGQIQQRQPFLTRSEKNIQAAQNAARVDQEATFSSSRKPTGDPARDGILGLLERVGRIPSGGFGDGDSRPLLEGKTGG